jgi:deoxyribodipyrimidine photo-lyase
MKLIYYTPDYDLYSSRPNWAKETLEEHKKDGRKRVYTCEQLENAETHDPYWNAAMKETVHTGYMHCRMRMHWESRSALGKEDPGVV